MLQLVCPAEPDLEPVWREPIRNAALMREFHLRQPIPTLPKSEWGGGVVGG